MSESGLRGLLCDESPRTARPAAENDMPAELAEREFTAMRVKELRGAGIAYGRTAADWATRRWGSLSSPA